MLPRNRHTNTHPVLKSLLGAALLLREEGADPRFNPTEDRDKKGNLNFVTWMDEMVIVDGPECDGELDQLLSTKEMLRLLLVYDQAFLIQGIPHPLVHFRSAWNSDFISEYTHIVDLHVYFLLRCGCRSPERI